MGAVHGTGYSQTCADSDGDGICDSTYIFNSNNIDNPPLKYNPGIAVKPRTGQGPVYFKTDVGVIENLTALNISDTLASPLPLSSENYAYGLFRFNITGLMPGSSANLTITLTGQAPNTYYNYGPDSNPHWYIIPSTITGKSLTVMLTDNGTGDNDLKLNGIIEETGGPSIPPFKRKSITTLDNKGRVVEGQVPGIVPVQFTYDARGHLSDITQGTRTYALRYDTQGNLANITDPLSRTADFEYDPAGRITKQTFPDGRQVQYIYDAGGNVVSITPPGRPDHAFNYTPIDLIKDYTPPDIGTGATSTSYTYNIDRQLTRVMRPDGAAIDFGYDSAGRLSTVKYPQGTAGLSYDAAAGNLKDITAPDGGMITYAYDGSLLTDTTWSGAISGSVHRTYDNNFSIISESVNGANTVNFQYDLDGLLIRAGLLSLSRDPQNGLFTGSALGNITDAIGYSSFGEVAGYQAAYSGAGIFSVNYTRDDIGRIVRKNETIDDVVHTYAYMYDQAGRLTNVSRDGVMISQYVYDTNGNRLSYTGTGGTISGTYDSQDRLLQYGTTAYTYTANGELLSKTNGTQTTTYQYDALGNLINVTMPDGTKIEYIIDGQNRRIGKKVNGALVQGFLYRDGLRPVAELDGAGNAVSRFVYAGSNVPDYMLKGSVTYRIIIDHLGSPRIVIDASTGAVVQRMDYDEFGNVTSDTNPGVQPFGFAGGIYDRDTELVRFGARDYDSETGRWTVKDPIMFAGGDTNLYGYVLNDPINYLDPTGRDLVDDWAAGMSKYVGGASKWIKENIYNPIKNSLWPTTVPIGPVSIDPQNGEISAGGSAGIEVGGKEVVGVSAECGVRSLPGGAKPHEPMFNLRTNIGANIPAFSKIPLIGEYFSNSHETNTPFGQIDSYEGKSSQTEAANRVSDTSTGELK